MSELIKIRDMANRYDLSARTLRYYEDMGLIKSVRREDYAYRLYDEVNRLIEITEKLDDKIPDIMIVRIPKFRAVTSGLISFEELFGGEFEPWQEARNHLFKPVIFDAADFLCEKDGKVEWIWALRDDVTKADVSPYEIIEYPGGLYAVAVSVDGDGESNNQVRNKTERWLERTNFIIDKERGLMGHMIYVDDEIKEGLGYHQMNLYTPIKLEGAAPAGQENE